MPRCTTSSCGGTPAHWMSVAEYRPTASSASSSTGIGCRFCFGIRAASEPSRKWDQLRASSSRGTTRSSTCKTCTRSHSTLSSASRSNMPQGERPPLTANVASPRSFTACRRHSAINAAAACSAPALSSLMRQSTRAPGLTAGSGVVPPSDRRRQCIGLHRTPSACRIGSRRVPAAIHAVYYRIDDSPGLLDGVLAREPRGIAAQGIANQALVCSHLACLLVAHQQLARAAAHCFAGFLRVHTETDRHPLRSKPKADVVRCLAFRAEQPVRRRMKPDHNLGSGRSHTLPGTNEERHSCPACGIDVQAQGHVCLDRRVSSDILFAFTVTLVLPSYHARILQGTHGL